MSFKIPKNIVRVRDEFSDFQAFLDYAQKHLTSFSFSWKNVSFYELWEKNSLFRIREHLGTYCLAVLGDFLDDKINTHVHWFLNYDLLEKQIIKLLKTDKVETVSALVQKRGRLLKLFKRSKKTISKSLDTLKELITLLEDSQPKEYKPNITLCYRFNHSYLTLQGKVDAMKKWLNSL